MKFESRRPCVLICDPIAEVGLEMLREQAGVDVKTGLSPADLSTAIGKYEAIVVGRATKVMAEAIENAHRLKVIGRVGAGLDSIDVVAAQNRGIKVVNYPDAKARAVAERTLALLLALVHHLPRTSLSLKEGQEDKSKLTSRSLAGKTLGIIGFGRIGREVAIRAQAFGMKVIVNQRRSTPELDLETGVEAVDLNDLLTTADFVSLHTPSKTETRNLIGAAQLALMKPATYLVNITHSSLVDGAALLKALDKGQIAGAALNVFAGEADIDNRLARHKRVMLNSPISTGARNAQHLALVTVIERIIEVIRQIKIKIPLSLQIVPLDKVFPHENVDPRRVAKLAKRLQADGVLMNPPLVIEADDRYVVLDGANRITALKQLGYPHVVVQIITDNDKIDLHTWMHAIRQADPAELVKLLDDRPEISMKETQPQKVLDEMLEYGSLCYLHTIEGRVFLITPAPGVNRLEALNKLAETYIGAYPILRTLNSDLVSLGHECPDVAALIVFPERKVEQILQVARAGRVIPAGITRFIIPGRVLRLNVDLNYLKSDKTLPQKNEWLYQLLLDKQTRNEIRYYEEPVYLLDE